LQVEFYKKFPKKENKGGLMPGPARGRGLRLPVDLAARTRPTRITELIRQGRTPEDLRAARDALQILTQAHRDPNIALGPLAVRGDPAIAMGDLLRRSPTSDLIALPAGLARMAELVATLERVQRDIETVNHILEEPGAQTTKEISPEDLARFRHALERLEDDNARLIELIDKEQKGQPGFRLLYGLARYYPDLGLEAAIPEVVLVDRATFAGLQTEVLRETDWAADELGSILETADPHSPELFYGVVLALGELGTTKATDHLRAALAKYADGEKYSAEEAESIILAIGHAGVKDAVENLSFMLTDRKTDKRIQLAIIEALGMIGNPEVIGFLSPFLASEDANYRQRAAEALANIGTNDAIWLLDEAITRLIERSHTEQSIFALALIDSDLARQILEKLINEGEEPVRTFAAKALGASATPENIALLLDTLTRHRPQKGRRDAVRSSLTGDQRRRIEISESVVVGLGEALSSPEVAEALVGLLILQPNHTGHLAEEQLIRLAREGTLEVRRVILESLDAITQSDSTYDAKQRLRKTAERVLGRINEGN